MIMSMKKQKLWIIVASCVFIGTMVGGCETQLFPDNLPRSPYERYDSLRGRNRPMSEQNAYGGTQPSVRNRLKPLGSP
jgi:hypothetical protein